MSTYPLGGLAGNTALGSATFTTTTGQAPDPARDLAPGLTMQDLDALLREHYAKGYRKGKLDGGKEVRSRIPHERREAAEKAEADLLQWMWPNVMHKVLSVSERVAELLDGPKSTIDNDRKRLDWVLTQLKQSLHTFHGKRPSNG